MIAGVLTSQMNDNQAIGADQTIATDDPAAVNALPRLDAVADAVGGKTAEFLIAKVKPGGVFATVLAPPAKSKEFPKVKIVVLSLIAEGVLQGKLIIPIGRGMPMAEAAKAHDAIAKGFIQGKVLLVNGTSDASDA